MKNNVTQNRTSFLKSIRNTILLSGLGLAIFLSPSCKKSDDAIPKTATPTADYGTIHYTLTNYAGKITKDEKLYASSNCHLGPQSTVTFSDNHNNFSIGINASTLKNGTYGLAGSTSSTNTEYSIAKYTWYDAHTATSNTGDFQEGQSIITDYQLQDKMVKVHFSYSLTDPDHNNEPVTLEGYAVIKNIIER